jgi:hypothetical protein
MLPATGDFIHGALIRLAVHSLSYNLPLLRGEEHA